jgi:hypothetical protein
MKMIRRITLLSHKMIIYSAILAITLSLIYPLSRQPLSASETGLRVLVHPDNKFQGSICVSSTLEDLGCKQATGPKTVEFRFRADSVEVGQKFKVCVDGSRCVTAVNSPARAPENIYLLAKGGTSVPSTSAASSGSSGNQETVNRLLAKCQIELPGASKEVRCTNIGSKALCIAFGASIGIARESCDNLPPIF